MTRLTSLLVALAAVAGAAFLWLGCGVKGAPIPPEEARPERILDLRAEAVKSGIRLSWGRPREYVSGKKLRDLAGFTVMRAGPEGRFKKLADIPVTDQERFQVQRKFGYLDSKTKIGQQYRYEVLYETSDGYVSAPSNLVAIKRTVPPPPPNPENFVLPTPTPLP